MVKNTLILLGVLLVSGCDLFKSNYDKMIGETPYQLSEIQRAKMEGAFGKEFVDGSSIFLADFTKNKNSLVINGRSLIGVYAPAFDKMWINKLYDSESIVYHEMAHRWQNVVLKRNMQLITANDGKFSVSDLELAIEGNYPLGIETEARIVEAILYEYVNYKNIDIYKEYMRKIMLLKIE